MSGEYLLVFNAAHDTPEELCDRIQACKAYQRIIRSNDHGKIKWHLLYVAPKLPSYAMLSEELVQWQREQDEHALKLLHHLGKLFSIPGAQQYLRHGSARIETWRFQKLHAMTAVFGCGRKRQQNFVSLKANIREFAGKINDILHGIKGHVH